MGITINHDVPYTPEIKQYLKDRGRAYLIPANERRFGEDGTRQPDPHELHGGAAVSPFYDSEQRAKPSYDVGGAPLPGSVLDYDSGRVADRDNGVTVEYTGPGHTPGAHDLRTSYEDEGFTSRDVDAQGNPIDDDIADDIVDHIQSIPNVTALKAELKYHQVEFDKDDKRENLEDKLAVFYDDARKAGQDVELGIPEEEEK